MDKWITGGRRPHAGHGILPLSTGGVRYPQQVCGACYYSAACPRPSFGGSAVRCGAERPCENPGRRYRPGESRACLRSVHDLADVAADGSAHHRRAGRHAAPCGRCQVGGTSRDTGHTAGQCLHHRGAAHDRARRAVRTHHGPSPWPARPGCWPRLKGSSATSPPTRPAWPGRRPAPESTQRRSSQPWSPICARRGLMSGMARTRLKATVPPPHTLWPTWRRSSGPRRPAPPGHTHEQRAAGRPRCPHQ